jgi:hypothetical protein
MAKDVLITPASGSIEVKNDADALKVTVVAETVTTANKTLTLPNKTGTLAVTTDVPNITGAASTVVTDNLTASRAVVSNASGKIDVSTVTSTELGYVSGVTSAIQTQINGTVKTTGNQTIAGAKSFSGSISLTASGPTNALNLNNNNITGVNHITINDPGPNEGIEWVGGSTWKIYESPNDLTTNSGGNLQIVQNTTRRATFNTSGQLEIPVATGTSPLSVSSTTVVTNLNADLIDGIDSSRIVFGGNATKTTNISNLNTPLSSGFYDSDNGTGNPTADWYSVLNVRHNNTGNNYGFQFAGNFFNSTDIFYRSLQGSNPTAVTWNKIWHAGNDGAGSTLDADLLDGQQGSYFLDTSGNAQTKSGPLTINNNLSVNRYFQNATGIPTSNLGSPTVTEMALFDAQFDNKTAFYPIANLKFYTSTDNITFTEHTTPTDTQKRRFLGGDINSGITIPNLTPYFRIEITNAGSYVFLNALYIYWASQSHSTTVKIRARRRSDLAFIQWTNSSSTVSAWPGHLYLPFSTIPFLTGGTSSGHYDIVHIDFQPTWSGNALYGTFPIILDRLQLWGGYPAGKRNIYSTDENRNVSFPTNLHTSGYLGVGTTSPSTRLYITDNADSQIFVNKTSATWTGYATGTHAMQIVAPNMGNASNLAAFEFGKALSVKNSAHIDYMHRGDGSNSNYLSFGLFGANELVNLNGAGNLGIGTTTPSEKLDVNGNIKAVDLILSGNLTVNGTTTNINTTNLVVEDKNIVIGDVATPTDVTADGGGITLKGATDKTIIWVDSTDRWTSNQVFGAPNYVSTVATGTQPYATTSTTVNTNLNADLLDGLHASAFVSARTRTNWNTATSVISNVVGELAWKNYGNNHTIFDASNSTTPSGTTKNNTNPDIYWSASYPTLMGWNGTNTYGVRVDSARVSDNTTGSSERTTFVNSPDGDRVAGNKLPTSNPRTVRFDFASSGSVGAGNTGSYAGVMTYAPWDGTTSSTGDSSYQLAFVNDTGGNGTGLPGLRLRKGIDSTWGSWNKIWHEGNDGTGSGLDADLLDGNHASAFVLKAGDTMTGQLNMSNNNLIVFGPNTNWGKYLSIGGNANSGNADTASIGTTNGNLHIDAATNFATYLNFYKGTNGVIFGNGAGNIVSVMGPDGDLWKGASDNTGSKYWHAGNDGAGSGLDADLLDGLNSASTNTASTIVARDASGNFSAGAISGTSLSTGSGASTWSIDDNTANVLTFKDGATTRLEIKSSGLHVNGSATALGSGTVTGVTATSPIASSGGSAPVISVASGFTIPTSLEKGNYDTAYTHSTTTTGSVHGSTTVGDSLLRLTNPGAITFLRVNADNTVTARSASDFRSDIGAGTGNGTVTSVTGTSPVASSGGTTPAISLASGYGDTLNPYASKTQKTFLAAPNGANGVPTFRTIAVSDVPTLNQNTTGNASTVTNGVYTTGTQSIGGLKTFTDDVTITESKTDLNFNALTINATSDFSSGVGNTATGLRINALSSNATFGSATGIYVSAISNSNSGAVGIFSYAETGLYTAQNSAGTDGVRISGRAGGTSYRMVNLTPTTLTASRTLTLPDTTGTVITSGDSSTVTNTMLAGSIADSKLSTISTAGKVSNSATTATSANTASAIVARDGSGNFTAGTITASLTGTASGNALTSHTHGNITSAGAIGGTSGLPIITTTSGVLTAGSFGTTAGTFTQGNDSRLSNNRIAIFWEGINTNSTAFASKSVTISGFVRTTGALIRVRFSNGSRVANPTLNISSTGAANIRIEGANATIDNFSLSQNTEVTFRWDGTFYQVISINNSGHARIISAGLTIPSGLTASYINVFGARFILLQAYHTSVSPNLSVYNLWIDMTDANQISTTARSHRVVWNNGTSTFADTIQAQLSGTSVRFSSSSGGTWVYRLTAF